MLRGEKCGKVANQGRKLKIIATLSVRLWRTWRLPQEKQKQVEESINANVLTVPTPTEAAEFLERLAQEK